MVQREIKNKTKLYTIAAVLSALILASAIYTVTTPSIMYGALGMSPMKQFTSMDELRNYIVTNTNTPEVRITGGGFSSSFWTRPDGDTLSPSGGVTVSESAPVAAPTSAPMPAEATSVTSFSVDYYSSTNIQVAGVDEADTVKTDGKYIYAINYDNMVAGSNVQIVNADPKNPLVVGKIAFDGSTHLSGMYLSANGNKLAVLGNIYKTWSSWDYIVSPDEKDSDAVVSPSRLLMPYFVQDSFIYVYDVSNKAAPVLTRNVTLSGGYVNSRMVGNYVYLMASQYAYADDELVLLPRISIDDSTKDFAPTSIYYTDIQDASFSYTLFNSINIMNDAEQPTSMTILMGASSCMYASVDNMYLTFNKYSQTDSSQSTELYRVGFNGAKMSFKAQGTVPGYVLNQYSMDEYANHFRIATTVASGSWDSRVVHNNVYVLNMNLGTVGKIENLAEGERIFSARFTGDKAYIVTFEQIDPFFVLDLKNPTSPKVAGELKIPGFSNYLHPYNENYIIGLGQEGTAVKLSLFDVTNMNNPVEVAKYLIDENNAHIYSTACHDPKAFLFSLQKQLIVIPVEINYWQTDLLPEPLPRSLPEPPIGTLPEPTAIPQQDPDNNSSANDAVIIAPFLWSMRNIWTGVYVFNISPENGFTLQNNISHRPAGNNDPWIPGVYRSLYIGNTLYTLSDSMIQLNSLDDFHLIAQVIF